MRRQELPGHLFTIGYSGFTVQQFIDTLNDFAIHVIIDVRSAPYSARFSEYNSDNMKHVVATRKNWKHRKVYYLNLPENFGARQTNPAYYTKEKYVDFAQVMHSPSFLEGCNRVHTGLHLGYNIVLMCAEIEPSHCHRGILIARWFDLHGYKIEHILPTCVKSQSDIDEELLKKYLKNSYTRHAMSGSLLQLDKTPKQIRAEDLVHAYEKQNKAIGFRITEEEDRP